MAISEGAFRLPKLASLIYRSGFGEAGFLVNYFDRDREAVLRITLASWTYNDDFLVYMPNPTVDTQNFYDNQEWLLEDIRLANFTIGTERAGNFSAVTLTLDISRQSFYYIFNLVIPATTVTLTSVFGQFAPVARGIPRQSRFQLGIVTLLPMGLSPTPSLFPRPVCGGPCPPRRSRTSHEGGTL